MTVLMHTISWSCVSRWLIGLPGELVGALTWPESELMNIGFDHHLRVERFGHVFGSEKRYLVAYAFKSSLPLQTRPSPTPFPHLYRSHVTSGLDANARPRL